MTKRRVLIVDDERGIREAVRRSLERSGYAVLLAGSGEEACEVLETQPVDAVVMDLRMPTMSGQTLFHLIITQWPELRSRVVVISGDPEAHDHEPWLQVYQLPVLAKPFELAELRSVLDSLTAEERREANEG